MECRHGRGRPRKNPTDDCLKPLPSFLLHPINQKSRILTMKTHMEESTVGYWWDCDKPRKGPNDKNLQPLMSFDLQPVKEDFLEITWNFGEAEEDWKRPNKEIVRPLSCVFSQTIATKPRTITRMVLPKECATIDISGSAEEITSPSNARNPQESSPWNAINTPPSATMECRRGRGRPRKRPKNEYHQPLARSNTHMGLTRESVALDIPKLVEEQTPYSNEEDTPESSDVGERTHPEATVERRRRGRGRPRKIPNDDSLRPLSCSLWEPTTKKARTKTCMVLKKETVITIDLPKLVEERIPVSYAQKTEELPHWSETSVAQLPDVGERTPLDGPKAEELPNCIDKEERNDKERAKELNLPPRQPVSDEVPEDSSRPWMWGTEIPGPIPPDIYELPWEIGLLSNFWCGVPVL